MMIYAIQRVYQMGHGQLTLLIHQEILVETLQLPLMRQATRTLFIVHGAVGNLSMQH